MEQIKLQGAEHIDRHLEDIANQLFALSTLLKELIETIAAQG